MTIEDKDGDTFAVKPEKHHICPLSGATSLKESAKELRKDEKNVLNSPVMKSIISNKANQIIRDKSESEYFDYLSSIAPSTHLLPDVDDFGREDGEHRSTYYSRLAKKRFRNIKDAVANELDLLKG